MRASTWQQAVQNLLSHHGVALGVVPEAGDMGVLRHLVRGTGFAIEPLTHGLARMGAAVDGALLELKDGSWMAVTLRNGQAYVLSSSKERRIATDEDMALVKNGYILHRPEPVKDHLLSFYRHHKKPVLQILACGFFINFFGLSLPVFSSFVYDKILGNDIHETLWALALGLLLMVAIDFFVRTLRVLTAERFAIGSEADIDGQIFRGLLAAHANNLPSIGSFLDRYKRLLASRDLLSSSYLLALTDIPFLLFFAFALIVAAGPLVLIPLMFGSLLLLSNLCTAIPLYAYDRRAREPEDGKFRILTDVLASHEAIARCPLGAEMTLKWRESCAQTSSFQSLSRYWRSMGQNCSNELTFLSYIAVLIGGVYMVDGQTLTGGGLLAASMLSSRMMAGFGSVVAVATRYKEFKKALREMNALLPKGHVFPVVREPYRLTGRVSFNAVSCALGCKANPVLSEVSAQIGAGETVGIAGMPGSGKTTLLRLVSGALAPDEGDVLIDHYPVRALSVDDMAVTVGYKPQDLCLVDGSIEDNVRAGRAPLTAEQRERVLTMSGLGWVFQQGGIDWTTDVGPRGAYLSGGQKQLVALARTFLTPCPVLLFDEPTNGLDRPLEVHLLKQLSGIKGHATLFLATHNREFLALCDRIIVVGNGRFLANGPKDKVLVARP